MSAERPPTPSIETIRDALNRMHRYATWDGPSYMSIPANPRRDADLILSAAIDELERLRAELESVPRSDRTEPTDD